MKRILAAILMVILLLGAVSCSSKSDVPEGYMQVALDDEIFNLYIPQNWQSNGESGMSGGFSSYTSGVMVSAFSTVVSEAVALHDYANTVEKSYQSTLSEYEMLSSFEEVTLASHAALRFTYKIKSGDRDLKFVCILVKTGAYFTSLSCCAPKDTFDLYKAEFDKIASYFTFRDEDFKAEDDPFVLTDENTPDGFYLASRNNYEFRFYVPDTWTVNINDLVPSAYYSKKDVSNVRLNSFTVKPDIMDGKSYWENFKKYYGYELTDVVINENAKLGQYDALEIDYATEISGIKYRLKQVFLTTPSMIYIFTYTSNADHYAEHLDDVNKMISMFEFK